MSKTIFLDLDGVCVDLTGAICKLITKEEPTQELAEKFLHTDIFKMFEDKDVWGTIRKEGPSFWANLELFPWTKKMVEYCSKHGQVAFLTSPGNLVEGAEGSGIASHGKTLWVKKHFPNIPLVITRDKYFCAKKDTFLVDDLIRNCELFNKNGGTAFHFPNQYTLLAPFDKDSFKNRIQTMKKLLDLIKD